MEEPADGSDEEQDGDRSARLPLEAGEEHLQVCMPDDRVTSRAQTRIVEIAQAAARAKQCFMADEFRRVWEMFLQANR